MRIPLVNPSTSIVEWINTNHIYKIDTGKKKVPYIYTKDMIYRTRMNLLQVKSLITDKMFFKVDRGVMINFNKVNYYNSQLALLYFKDSNITATYSAGNTKLVEDILGLEKDTYQPVNILSGVSRRFSF